jgi:hypothetical protein
MLVNQKKKLMMTTKTERQTDGAITGSSFLPSGSNGETNIAKLPGCCLGTA